LRCLPSTGERDNPDKAEGGEARGEHGWSGSEGGLRKGSGDVERRKGAIREGRVKKWGESGEEN